MADDYHMSTQPYQRDSTAERLKTKAAEVGQKLSERLSAFGEKAKRVLTGQARGDTSHAGAYANLNESLLSQDGGDASQSAGLHAATNGLPPSSHAGIATASSGSEAVPGLADIPSEAEMMVQTTLLAQEAAELLWETIAFQAGSENKDPQMVAQMTDLTEKAEMLNSQLRGLIRNHLQGTTDGTSEQMLASALEAKDMLDSCLTEYKKTCGSGSVPSEHQNQQQVAADPPQQQHLDTIDAVEPAPLIDLDDLLPAPSTQAPTATTHLTAPGADPFAGSSPGAGAPGNPF